MKAQKVTTYYETEEQKSVQFFAENVNFQNYVCQNLVINFLASIINLGTLFLDFNLDQSK